ncbi:copper resistance D family protein [Massilia luteola]|uniref:copper resistance D family protein n=1 Tax=Massilia luteola TaxID=3081751 RepID=UPI002ACC25DD|nr:CopD family protein [Massilia sp. Gc5]
MAPDLPTVQRLVTALLNLAVAVLTGASVSRLWLGRDASDWAAARRRPVRMAAVAAAAVSLAASVVWLWLESAAMAEVPLAEAGRAVWTMLLSTHLGFAYCVGTAGLAVAAAGALARGGASRWPARVTLAALAVFWYTRSMVSHAASDGDFGVRVLADWVHLGAISLWVGEVVIAAAIILKTSGNMAASDWRARSAYVASLSNSATVALGAVFVTGGYAAWRSIGGWDYLIGNPYANTLVAKVLVAGLAAALGGFNRFVVMPPWLARESAGRAAPDGLPARFKRVLRIEALLLLAAVVLAAWLASTAPPGEQM